MSATLSEKIERVAASASFGQPTAAKRGRDARWPYVPVIDHGTHTAQIKGLAYATRAEAVDAAECHVKALRADLARHLAEPRYRALREQYGLPRDLVPAILSVARDRGEDEACQAGTPGCCVDHSACEHGCETW